VEGNIVYDRGRDEVTENDRLTVVPPRYKYAVFVSADSGELKRPVSLQFSNNMLHPDTGGISNVELKP
jgi:hypothetical protein